MKRNLYISERTGKLFWGVGNIYIETDTKKRYPPVFFRTGELYPVRTYSGQLIAKKFRKRKKIIRLLRR